MMKRIYFILLAVIAYACVEIPSDLSIPEWDVELNIPITDRFYNMDSLLKDSEYGRTEQYGNYLVYSFYSDTIQYKSGISNLLEDKLDFEYLDHIFPLAEGEIEISIPLPDSIYIENAEFVSGECIFEIHNMSSKSVDYMIKFTDFTQYGKKISIENEISAYQFESLSIDLIDAKYISENGTSIKMLIEASGNFDSNSDSAKISLKMKNTILKKIRGKLPPTYIDNISESVNIDFDSEVNNFRNNIKLDDAEMHLIARYKSQYSNIPEVRLSNLSILGEYETESLYFEENESQILQNILIQETEYKKVYNSKNSNVNDFLAFLPSNLTLSGTCLINPENKIFEASIYDSIEVVSFIRSPLRLSLDSISIKDTVEHDLGDEKDNLDNSNRASIISKITNGLPLSIDAYISIVDDKFQNIVRKKVTVSSATILSDLEYSPILTESEILLDSLDLANISKSFYVIYDLRLKGNKNQLVTFKTTDGIDIKSFLNLDYRIKED